MDLFEKQAQLHSLFQRSPVDAAYTQGSASGRKLAGQFSELDVALLLLDQVKTNEFFDYQVYFVSELSKTLETQGLDVSKVRTGKEIVVTFDARDEAAAEEAIRTMGNELLANPVIEDYEYDVKEAQPA